MKNKSPNRSEMKIKEFLDKRAISNPTDCFSALDISTQVYNQPYSGNTYVSNSIKNLLLKGEVKIVSFGNTGRPYPMYQSAIGSLPSIRVIDEDSEKYQKLKLISVSTLCKECRLPANSTSKVFEEIEKGKIKEFYTHNKARGYFLKFERKKLEKVIEKLIGEGEVVPFQWAIPNPNIKVEGLKSTVDWFKPNVKKDEPEPILLPDLRAKERFQPRDLFKRVFNLFGYKLNLNITIERKKTIANTGQDLIDF